LGYGGTVEEIEREGWRGGRGRATVNVNYRVSVFGREFFINTLIKLI